MKEGKRINFLLPLFFNIFFLLKYLRKFCNFSEIALPNSKKVLEVIAKLEIVLWSIQPER